METAEEVIDLKPSPWRAFGIVMGVLTIAFVAFAIAIWPHGDDVRANVGRVVVTIYAATYVIFVLGMALLVALFATRRPGSST
jgi:putative effector of murein hydrolase